MNVKRNGLRLRSLKGVDPEVRRACLDFCKWLRKNIYFPVRIVIYLKKDYRLRNLAGEFVSATFFAPYDKNVEPYIKIATGDFCELEKEWGRDRALAAYLNSIAHEIIHYIQWLNDLPFDERKANYKSKKLVDKYALIKQHP